MNIHDFFSFISSSPTPYHTIKEMGNRLATYEFEPLDDDEPWDIQPGEKYFYEKDGSFVCFRTPKNKPTRAIIIGSHTDSPCLKLKPTGRKNIHNMITHGVEVYGSPYLSSWIGRDLIIAGKITYLDESGEIEEQLIQLDEFPILIPNIAIHLDRKVNEEGHKIQKQKHLTPILGLNELGQETTSLQVIEKYLKNLFSFQKLLGFDLFAIPTEKPSFIGFENELIASYRIDNLSSAYSALYAIAHAENRDEHLQMAIFWNHEEIGSSTKEGALSPFFEDIFKRITTALGVDEREYFLLKNHSFCFSSDSAHAVHPNYAEKHDEGNPPLLGKGVAIKYNANMRYATTSKGSAIVKKLCMELDLPLQSFVSHSDMPCGSTIGPLFSQTTGIETIDIGIPQLAMHSIRELMAVSDLKDLGQLLKGALQRV